MKQIISIVISLCLLCTIGFAEEPKNNEMVRVADYIPEAIIDLKYATTDNFTGERIYDFDDAYLRYGTVKKLRKVQDIISEDGYVLKIWDAFRPPIAQFKLWEICPDSTYVANPNKGYSSHSRGNTVDVTIVRADGTEVEMPTDFDDFTKKADRNYNDCTKEAGKNARYLEKVMKSNGFKPYKGEWWHFSDEKRYDVNGEFLPPAMEQESIPNLPTDEQANVAEDSGKRHVNLGLSHILCKRHFSHT